MGFNLQRLFSTFPDGWPGLGLLLLRLSLGVYSISCGIGDLSGKAYESMLYSQSILATIGGLLLLLGLWTPVAGIITAVGEGWIALSLYPSRLPETEMHALLAVLSMSLAMLGPGTWSIDSRLFGRRRFDIDRASGKKQSR